MKSKKMIALIIMLALTFSATSGYACGTLHDTADATIGAQSERLRPARPGAANPAAADEAESKTDQVALPSEYKDGVYRGSAPGYGGPLEVEVTVKGGKITDLKVLKHNETPGYYEDGAKVIDRILKAGNLEVDTISGATVTSHAIIAAAAKALGSAPPKKSGTSGSSSSNRRGGGGRSSASRGGAAPVARSTGDFSGKTFKDGTYRGQAEGFAGPVTVEVAISGGKIIDARYVSGNEDAPYIDNALAVLEQIVAKQGTQGVDTVSGATYSSIGLINAANQALSQAVAGSDGSSMPTTVLPQKDNTGASAAASSTSPAKEADAPEPAADAPLTDGTFAATALGYGGPLELVLTVQNGKVQDLRLGSHQEDAPYLEKALPLLEQIRSRGSTQGIDTVSGATYSSKAILNAARRAFAKAAGQPVAADDPEKKRLQEEIVRLKALAAKNDAEDVSGALNDGTYRAAAIGYAGAVEVQITVQDGKLKSARVGSNQEDAPYLAKAEAVLADIVEHGGTAGVDTVSGATYTSRALLNATRKAMAKAAGGGVVLEDVETEAEGGISAEKAAQMEAEIERLKAQLADADVGTEDVSGIMKDGTYSASARGYNGPIEVEIIVKDGKLIDARVVHHEDDSPYFDDATYVLERIIEKGGTSGVDKVSGASVSSYGILNAVRKAMIKAGATSGDILQMLKDEVEKTKAIIAAFQDDTNDYLKEVFIEADDRPLHDGTFTGIGRGWCNSDLSDAEASIDNAPPYGRVRATVTIENGAVTAIELDRGSDTRSYFHKAKKHLVSDIMAAGSIANVEICSGATYSSRGIIEAVGIALMKARTGSDDLALRKERDKLKAENDRLRDLLAAHDIDPDESPGATSNAENENDSPNDEDESDINGSDDQSPPSPSEDTSG